MLLGGGSSLQVGHGGCDLEGYIVVPGSFLPLSFLLSQVELLSSAMLFLHAISAVKPADNGLKL